MVYPDIQISVVIPTCNRRERLISLLMQLNESGYPFKEVIVVDSGEDRLNGEMLSGFKNLSIQYLSSQQSVCLQRNTGIRKAVSDWIFLCDDDIEVPGDYILKLLQHIQLHEEAGAVSGIVLQKEEDRWTGIYPVTSAKTLLWNYFFGLSSWGPVTCKEKNFLVRSVLARYRKKGNHLSKAGWPVLVNFGGAYFTTPVYGLGASLVKKEWLLKSPYDEVLDRHGIGDNYGVAAGFPAPGIQVVTSAFVYHHQDPVNRLQRSLQYYRRTLALDYFIKTKPALKNISRFRLLWSLAGQLTGFIKAGDGVMAKAAFTSIRKILFNRNPYIIAYKKKNTVTEPVF